MKIIRFISYAVICCSIGAGCSTTSGRHEISYPKPVTGNNNEVKSFAAAEKYSERPATVVKNQTKFRPASADRFIIKDENIRISVYAKEFAQGNAAYFEAVTTEGKRGDVLKITFSGEDIPFTKVPWGCRGIFAIDPEAKPGKAIFTVLYSGESGEQKLEGALKIRDVQYPVSESLLDLGKFSDKEYTSKPEFADLIKESEEARRRAFSTVSDDSITNTLSHPRDFHKVTGDYWKKRIYAAYKKKGKKKVKVRGHVSYHRGLDMKGDVGAPVYSMADGRIVLARKMFYEGNMVVVDHGNSIFSYYMHMDSVTVKDGDAVKAGDMVGRVGSTGTSTAPHLHVALSIRGVHVHPLSLLSLPVSR